MPIGLTDPHIHAFLASKDVVILATIHQNGAPLAMPMWFYADTDALYMVTMAATQKVRNIRRDARVCVVAESGTRGAEVRGVTVQGRAVSVDGGNEAQRVVTQLLQKYDPHLATLWGGATMPPNRVLLRIVPEQLHSWGLEGT